MSCSDLVISLFKSTHVVVSDNTVTLDLVVPVRVIVSKDNISFGFPCESLTSVYVTPRSFVPFLNGANGEATNTDDLDHADRGRARREARNRQQHMDPVPRNQQPTFAQLSRNLIDARRALAIAIRDRDPDEPIMRANVDVVLAEILRAYPDQHPMVALLPLPNVAEVRVDPEVAVMQRIRLYIVGETQVITMERLASVATVSTLGGLLAHRSGAPQVAGMSYLVGLGALGYGLYRNWTRLRAFGGQTPSFVGDSNKTVGFDATFSRMRVAPGTFWSVKGYTHYVEVDVPSFMLEHRSGGVQQVVSGCSTDSQLAAIAFSTLMRDQILLERFSETGPHPHDYAYYARYAGMFVAQQHMYHLFQSSLMSGRSGKITLPGWDGSSLNFRFGGRIHGTIRVGFYRQLFENTRNTDVWVDNGRFQVVRAVKQGVSYRLRCEPSVWLRTLGFTEVDHVNSKRLQRYRTRLLTFHNGGVLYARTNVNLISALNRMFTCRESVEVEAELRFNQYRNVRVGTRRLGKLLSDITSLIRAQFSQECEIDDLLGQLSVIEKSHPKKELRKEAFQFIQQMTLIKNAAYATKVTAKVKIEVAKFMKNARVYVDMTTPQSLLGGWLIDPLKEAMRTIDLGWCLMVFAKTTDESSMLSCFHALRDNEHRPVCVFHSDDAVMQLPCCDGVLRFNLDISSCDRSNLKPIFELLLECVPEGPWRFIYERMIQGCCLPLIIPNPCGYGEYFKVVPTEPFEYSGSNLTTSLNNMALTAITASIFHKFRRAMTCEQVKLLVPQCAKSVGYIVTVQVCKCVEQVQFLKFSPSDPVNWFPVRNLGCVLRAVGHYDGDLPGRGSLYDRALEHVSQVVSGITTGYIDPVAEVLRRRFISDKPLSNKYQYYVQKYSHTVPLSHVMLRYGLTESEVHILMDLVQSTQLGDIATSPVLDKIFSVDY